MPGKIIQCLKKTKTENPLVLIDEVRLIQRISATCAATPLKENVTYNYLCGRCCRKFFFSNCADKDPKLLGVSVIKTATSCGRVMAKHRRGALKPTIIAICKLNSIIKNMYLLLL